MIFINEWLPNPTGADVKNEFIELYNNSAVPVNLRGWILKTESGKKSTLSGVIGSKEYLVFKKTETKLTLKNVDGSLSLYFVFATPTPSLPNKISLNNSLAANSYPTDILLNQVSLGIFEIFGMILGLAVVLVGIVFYAVKQDENLSKLFFGRDEEVW